MSSSVNSTVPSVAPMPPAKTLIRSASNIIFFINRPLSERSSQVYYVVDLTESMFKTMYSCAYPKPGETQRDFAAEHLFQRNKLCTTLGGRGIWTRDETYATKPPYEKMNGEYEKQEKPKKEIALKLIDAMLEKVESLDTDEKRAKYKEYLHLRDKIIVYPITSLRFMFYYIKEEYRQYRDLVHISDEYIVNPVIEYAFEMVNHSLRHTAEGKKDFEEPGPKQSQSGLILYRGPTIPVPKFPRPEVDDDTDLESIRNAGIKKEEEIQEFNERRRKMDEQIIYERKYERKVIPPSTIIPGWRDVLSTWWQQKGQKGGKTKRVRTQKRLSKSKKSIKRNSQRHRKMSRKH